MGPPKFIGGNNREKRSCYERSTASMGPPKFIGGNELGRSINTACLRLASMGPPKFIGGNVIPGQGDYDWVDGFNGATEIHRWKCQTLV